MNKIYLLIVVVLSIVLNLNAPKKEEISPGTSSIRMQALSPAQELELMRRNLRNNVTLGHAYDPNNAAVKNHINGIAANANTYWKNMETSPVSYLWKDYNKLKDDTRYTPAHINYSYLRLLDMARAYAYEGSALYQNNDLLSDIIKALSFMYNYAYNEGTNRIGNFWEWRIGIPDAYARIISILYDKIPQEAVDSYSKAVAAHVRDFTVNGNLTFGNQASICKSLFYQGVLSGNMANIRLALDNLTRAFVDNTTLAERKSAQTAFEKSWKEQVYYGQNNVIKKEGLYEDGTFIQHIALPYIGGYGMELVDASAKMMSVLEGTGITLLSAIRSSLIGWFEKAFFPAMYEGEMMMMYMGRSVAKNPHIIGRGLTLDIFESAFLIENVDARKRIMETCKRMFSNNKYYPDIYSGLDPIIDKPRVEKLMLDASLASGVNKSFNTIMAAGDRVLHNRPNYKFGISMSSSRIGKFESIHENNTKGWYTGDGMTYIYNNDRAQYVNYFRDVNPKRLPGTTVDVINRVPITYNTGNYGLFGIPKNAKDWVGGVSLRGLYGAAGMHLVGEVSDLEAKKSWFMFDDEIVALGAGIKLTASRKVETIVENRAAGSLPLYVNGTLKNRTLGWSEAIHNVSWMHLEGTSGYYFPEPTTVHGERSWEFGRFTQLYLDHGTSPTDGKYAYVLCPSKSRNEIATYAENPDIQIMTNTKVMQAVYEKRLNIIGVNFWEAGSIDIIESKNVASVMLQRAKDTVYLSVSDPTWKLNTQQFVLKGNYVLVSGEKGKVIVSASGSATNIMVNCMDRMGKAHEIILLDKNYSSNTDVSSIKPNLSCQGNSTYIIHSLPPKGSSITVYNMLGEVVLTKQSNETSVSIDLSSYANGMYVFTCKVNESEDYVWKCMK